MKTNELRIGNYVMYADVICKVEGYSGGLLQTDGVYSFISKFHPIPINEKWLLKLGFEKRDDQKYSHLKFDRTWVSLDSILVKWYGNALGGIMMLDYVHQLQNIFFAINSEELELHHNKE